MAGREATGVTIFPMNAATRTLVTGTAALLLAALPPALGAEPPSEAEYRREIAAWKDKRDAGLRKEDSWLTLVGLSWLHEGDNSLGSAAGSDVPLPTGKAPAKLGVLKRAGERVTLLLAAPAGVTIDGEAAKAGEIALAADASGKPTMVRLGPLTFFIVARQDKIGVRIKDRESPVRTSFTGVESFPLDPAWRIRARFERYDPPKAITVPNILGQSAEDKCPGAVVFEVAGQTYRLEPTGEPGEELFLVFGDQTNGKETYGGGRFLDLPAPAADGTIVIDFNMAYNPPCVFTPYATCPLPPRQNKLALRVPAGEKVYGDGGHHSAAHHP